MAIATTWASLPAQDVQTEWPLEQESLQRTEGVIAGEMLQFAWNSSALFPGTHRTISVYVPRTYEGTTSACVAVFQDGGGFSFQIVFDNLIHAGAMPMTIGVIVPPGKVPGVINPHGVRHNRTFEYDSPGDRYARFLIEEILPAVEKLTTSDGRPIRLSHDGNDRMIAGASSGAAAAFNAAWARPDAFSRVFSAIGSYTGLRGSYVYPTLIHKTEPKALRIFLQSGTHDMWTSFGDWWSANNAMVRALSFAGYEFDHEFGTGKHSQAHGTALFPRAMRFLWKDWPSPVQRSAKSRNQALGRAYFQDQKWETLPGNFPDAIRIRSNANGTIFVTSPDKTFRIDSAEPTLDLKGFTSLWSFTADGTSWIASDGEGSILLMGPDHTRMRLASDLRPEAIAATQSGPVYAAAAGKVWLLRANHEPREVDAGPINISALTVTGDGNWLAAFESNTTRGFSYRIESDGTLSCKQTFYVLHKRDADNHPATRDAVAEASRFGYLHIATALGVQVCDANGRCAAILPLPGGAPAISLCFGGESFTVLYVLGADGKIYFRPTRNPGAAPFRPPEAILMKAG